MKESTTEIKLTAAMKQQTKIKSIAKYKNVNTPLIQNTKS